jgi:hypothetical protein
MNEQELDEKLETICSELGRGRVMDEQTRERMFKFRQDGISYRKIAEMFGLNHPNTARHHIIQYMKGVAISPSNRGLPIIPINKFTKREILEAFIELYDRKKMEKDELIDNILRIKI